MSGLFRSPRKIHNRMAHEPPKQRRTIKTRFMSKIPENNTTDFLCNTYGYTKKILTDQKLIEKMLLREIQTACRAQGYKLLELKIEKL